MTGFSPEELTREAYKLLAQDKARLGGLNYPSYKGPTVSPMSTLTQRARDLRENYSKKPAPYSQKIGSVLSRDNQGLSAQDVQRLSGQLTQNQKSFGQGPLMNILRKEFLSSFEPRSVNFTGKLNRDVDRRQPEITGNLQDIAKVSGNLEGARNRQLVRTLQDLQEDKQTRREGLIGNLEQFGAQKHAYNNMAIGTKRAQFEREANEPYRKLQMLEQALGATGVNPDQPLHPDLANSQNQQIAQALRAYGVDPSKPASQWSSNKTESSSFPGQLMADLPAEINASANVLERLATSPKDNYTNQRKALTADLVNNQSLSGKALQNVDPAIAGQVSMLEKEAKQRMKKDLEAINNQYIKLGQYKSPQHIKATENRARELNNALFGERNNALQGGLINQLKLQHDTEFGNIAQLGQIGQQSHKEYGDLLKTIRDTNQLGATKFANKQGENEELYKNYQNENLWQWPHMRNQARAQAAGDIFAGLADRNISLDNLANLNTRYGEMETDINRYRQDLLTTQQARDELQRQLGIMRSQEARAAADAENQRRQMAAEMNARRERERLEKLQSQAPKATQGFLDFNNWARQNEPAYLAAAQNQGTMGIPALGGYYSMNTYGTMANKYNQYIKQASGGNPFAAMFGGAAPDMAKVLVTPPGQAPNATWTPQGFVFNNPR